MSQAKRYSTNRVLVIGAQGVLGRISLDDLAPALREHGIAVISQPVTTGGAQSIPAPAGLHP